MFVSSYLAFWYLGTTSEMATKDMPPGGLSDEAMRRQAQQIWTMLDDMSQRDPAAYRAFIDKHMKEGKEAMKPPTPHMCISTHILVGDLIPHYIM